MPLQAGCSQRRRSTERSRATRLRKNCVAAFAVSSASGDGSSMALAITSSEACTAPVATRGATALRSAVDKLSNNCIARCCTLFAGCPSKLEVAERAARSRKKLLRGPVHPSHSEHANSTALEVSDSPAAADPTAATKRAMVSKRSCNGPVSSAGESMRERCSTAACRMQRRRGAINELSI
eukprot:scaffold51553_cov30-Tisochrysis_lutea.AAC.3